MREARAGTRSGQVDVICQHCKDGKIIPLKIRTEDEDGEHQVFAIRGYRERPWMGEYQMPNEVKAAAYLIRFECKIAVWGIERTVELLYNGQEHSWMMRL